MTDETKTLRFQGYSDDTFGELTTGVDHDNCANGEPIIFKVWSPSAEDGVFIVGHYCPGPLTGWMLGAGRLNEDDERQMPNWPMRIIAGGDTPYTPQLLIQVPADAMIEHWTDDET